MIRARFVCQSRTLFGPLGSYELVKFAAVYDADKDSPNYSFSAATPHATLEMGISNPAACGAFEAGKVYDLAFTEAPAEAQPEQFR